MSNFISINETVLIDSNHKWEIVNFRQAPLDQKESWSRVCVCVLFLLLFSCCCFLNRKTTTNESDKQPIKKANQNTQQVKN